MKVALITCFLLPLCLSQTCMLLNPAPVNNKTCVVGHDGCISCNSGYGMYLGNCYANCPQGWVQLMPGYCINATIINNHQNFTLCPTNETMYLTAGAGQYMCQSPNPECQCAPACPSGYTAIGCQCAYGVNLDNATNITSEVMGHYLFWLYLFSTIGLISIIAGATYLVRKHVMNREVKIPLQTQATINERYSSFVEIKQ